MRAWKSLIITASLLLFSLGSFISWSVTAEPVSGWSETTVIDNLPGAASTPVIAVNDAGYAVAVWEQTTGSVVHAFGCTYIPSIGWTTPTQLDANNSYAIDQISPGIDRYGNALVTYRTQFDYGFMVWCNQKPVEGAWSGQTMLVRETLQSSLTIDPDGNGVFAFSTFNPGPCTYGVSARRYHPDSGWSDAAQVMPPTMYSFNNLQVKADGRGAAVAVWTDQISIWGFVILTSVLNGSDGTWGPVQQIGGDRSDYPALDVSANGEAIVVWDNQNGIDQGVCARKWSGDAWSPIMVLDAGSTTSAASVSMQNDGSAIAVWQKSSQIWSSTWVTGLQWSEPMRLSSDLGTGNLMPKVELAHDGNASAVWMATVHRGLDNWVYTVLSSRFIEGHWRLPEALDSADSLWDYHAEQGMNQAGDCIAVWAKNRDIVASRYCTQTGHPSAPTELHLTPSPHGANVTWSDPLDDGGHAILSFCVYRSEGSGFTLIHTAIYPEHDFKDMSISDGTTYWYQISAVNSMGQGPRSQPESVIPGGCPSAPRDLTYNQDGWSFNLQWQPPENNGGSAIIGYRVYSGPSIDSLTLYSETSSCPWHDDLLPGDTRYYKVSAYNAIGEGASTPAIMIHLNGPPSAPRNVSAVAEISKNIISWEPSATTDAPVLDYKIYWSIDSSDQMYLGDTGNADNFIFNHTGVSPNELHHYYVSAVSSAGEGPRGGPATVISLAPYFTIIDPIYQSDVGCGENLTINWTSGFIGPMVGLELVLPSLNTSEPFEMAATIAQFIDNTGTYIWQVPNVIPSNAYRIRIFDESDPDTVGYSADFRVHSNPDTVPETTINPEGELGDNGCYVGPVVVTLAATDRGDEGISVTHYMIGGGEWIPYAGPIILSDDGGYNVYYSSIDNAGAVEETKMTYIGIDTVAPILTIHSPIASRTYGNHVMIWADANDNFIGVANISVTLDDQIAVTENGSLFDQDWSPDQGAHIIIFTATDYAGHRTQSIIEFAIDISLPTVLSCSPNGTNVPSESVIIIRFSEPMMPISVSIAGVYSDYIFGDWAECLWEGSNLTLTPWTAFKHSTNYTIIVNGLDASGNPLWNGYSWNFTVSAGITGFVKDEEGNVFSNATVVVLGANGNITATTNSTGVYSIDCVLGNYTMVVSAPGMQYRTMSVSVTAVPGSSMDVVLNPVLIPSRGGNEPMLLALMAACTAVIAVVAAAVIVIRRRKR